jgi:hypothetical protein
MEAVVKRGSQSGAMNISILTTIIVLVVIGYLAYKFVPPYFTNYRVAQVFLSEMRRQSPIELRANIEYKLRDLPHCPIAWEDVMFEWDHRAATWEDVEYKWDREKGVLTVFADYAVQVTLLGGHVKTLVFHPSASTEE